MSHSCIDFPVLNAPVDGMRFGFPGEDDTGGEERSFDLNGNIFTINQGAVPFLSIDPTAGAEVSYIRSFNITGGDNDAILETSTTNTMAHFRLLASFNGGATVLSITGNADASDSEIVYNANFHTFEGRITAQEILPDADEDHNLGSDVLRWQNLFIGSTGAPSFIHIGASLSDEATLSYTAGTDTLNVISPITAFSGNIVNNNRLLQRQGADVASVAGAITLGGDGNVFEITGTNTITLISNLSWQNGSIVRLIFTSTATLTDGTANSGTNIGMELAGNVNFVATANDVVTLVLSEVGGTQRWREVSRSVN